MADYLLGVRVCEETVRIIREEFPEYVKNAEGFSLHVVGNNEESPSEDLQIAVMDLFIHLLHAIAEGKLERIQ